ncbi:PaaI family thioesterase [Sphingomonas sp. LY54]|uniref:PaaI family thioesterase n=1 Tax=Sphingomonadales TaxID=204457 RepID=UPI002ADEE5A6|nr:MULTISPECIES: PaaI family thioesterase [Sphingomonadales]MEA1013338.1 PaaI family thioesterase [Sphingosinicella sp. LY1275]WRP28776.1 PaaI family thioesterase [Sphingomonas sp. LY54]
MSLSDKGFDPRLFMSYVSQVGHGGALGIAYHDHGPDWVELALDYDEKLIGVPASGIIASGPIISLMDMATSMAIWVKLDRFKHQATLDLRIDYLRPATPGKRIIGRGECYAVRRSVGFTRGLAHDGDPADPVAHVAATFMFTSKPG